jgi:hypothetical protein
VRILGNIESILGKMEQDGHMVCLYDTLENILRKETDFAVKGKVNRAEEAEAEVARIGFEVIGEDQWYYF